MNSEKMKKLREEKGLTQKELGEIVFTGQSMIAQLEAGCKDPSIALLNRIAEALDVEAAELL